jgi:rod shape-determining protein MreD
MSYFFNISVCLFLVILQTTVMPYLPLLDKFYDLLIPFIIYLSLSRPVRESLPFVLFLGFIMDNLSGGPFGLYLTTYFWLYVGVKGVMTFIQVGNRLFIITLIVVGGVLFENLVLLAAFAMLGTRQQFAGDALGIIAVQLCWAATTGSLFLLFFRNAQTRLGVGFKRVYARTKDQGQPID